MTANELLALLGRAWPRLLIYPGGLAAFALVWLIGRTKNKEQRTKPPTTDGARRPTPALERSEGTDDQGRRSLLANSSFSILHSQFPIPGSWLDISAIVLPWLGLALLPLPRVAEISRSIDAVAVLALLEWPLLLALAAELHSGDAGAVARGMRRLAAALNSYPALILATLVLASSAGSLDLAALARPPDESAPTRVALLHWVGAAAMILALPPALGIGAFASGAPTPPIIQIGLRLRAVGLVALAALPWFPLVAGRDESDFGGAAPALLLLPTPPLLIAALLWAYGRLSAGHAARRWARAYMAFDALLLLALVWAAYVALRERLG